MSRLILTCVGKINGMDVYAPLDSEDEKIIGDKKTIVCEMKSDRSARTSLQNRAMHKYFSLLATALNSAGWDMKKTLTKRAEIPWSETSIKEQLWRPIQQAILEKTSTAKLEANEVSQVYETLNRHTAQKLGVSVSFPDRYNQMLEAG